MYDRKIKTKLVEEIDLQSDSQCSYERYQLFATCTHLGSSRGGHYIAYTKHKNRWFLKDDISCNEISSINLSDFHYIIMYKRIREG